MAAEVHFAIHSDRATEILDELEQRTGVAPFLSHPSERRYNLSVDSQVDPSVLDVMLDRIHRDWPQHLSRSP